MQTGSGKTHTLVGDTENVSMAGIVPRAVQDIFAPDDPQISVQVSCTMLELYQVAHAPLPMYYGICSPFASGIWAFIPAN